MKVLAQSRLYTRITISSKSHKAGTVSLGAMPAQPRRATRVIEMQSRKPGEAGEQLRRMTRAIEREDVGPDVGYED